MCDMEGFGSIRLTPSIDVRISRVKIYGFWALDFGLHECSAKNDILFLSFDGSYPSILRYGESKFAKTFPYII